jgi:hypothetical protein
VPIANPVIAPPLALSTAGAARFAVGTLPARAASSVSEPWNTLESNVAPRPHSGMSYCQNVQCVPQPGADGGVDMQLLISSPYPLNAALLPVQGFHQLMLV